MLLCAGRCEECECARQVGFTEEDYIGLFDETPIPSGIQPGLPKKDDSSKKEVAPVGAGADADDSSKPKPSDYTGGLG